MIFLVSQFLFVLFVLVGLIIWASSEMPLAWREVAINTRKNGETGYGYIGLKVLSVCLKIMAVLVWILGIVALVMINAGSNLGGLLPSGL
ncbi:MAG TPA: hypothetical protein VFH83_14320 [Spirochaetia bacterium]|nr:hypothetical protein [Spirochaetia bacterium]